MKAAFLQRSDYASMMELLNRAFGFDTETNGFLRLLPKLYRPVYCPWENNLAVKEDGKIVGTVGIYPLDFTVYGKKLTSAGIGNVAVDASARGRGVMSFLMEETVRHLEAKGYDFALLGGQRQRYERFGFYGEGEEREFHVRASNVRYVYGSAPCSIRARKLERNDPLLPAVIGIHDAQPYRAERPADSFYDVLCSWESVPYVFLKGEEPVGYCVRKDDEIREPVLSDPADVCDAVRSLMGDGTLRVFVPPYETRMRLALSAFAESETVTQWEKMLVLRWLPVLSAAFCLRAESLPLDDGVLTLQVMDDLLTFTVKDGKSAVRKARRGEVPLLLLDRAGAMAFFFGQECGERLSLASPARWWFPLSLPARMADHV